jgi:hypothetical protein
VEPGLPRSILANLVNDVMIESPPDGYARTMAAVTPRKLWQAEPGDCVVVLAPCTTAFRDYVASITQVAADSVEIVAPGAIMTGHACDVVTELDATDRVAARPVLTPFVIDTPVVDFARRMGMRIDPYLDLPAPQTLAAVRLINTKAGFRAIAGALGLPVADGGFADTPARLAAHLKLFLQARDEAIVKVNRSSNGHGTFVVKAKGGKPVQEQVRRALASHPPRRCGWAYEEFLPFDATPSIEMVIDADGVHDFYTCDQRTRNNAWTGMVTPADSPALPELADAAARIGSWLAAHGYRGYFDVDCGLVGDSYVVTEANVRRTGGTYLEELARKLACDMPAHWRADACRGNSRLDFPGAVRALQRAGLSDPRAPARAVLIVDTLAVDGLWRYLVVGESSDAAAAAEDELAALLELT